MQGIYRAIRYLLPGRSRQKLLEAFYYLRGLRYWGDKVNCNCCERSYRTFISFYNESGTGRVGAECPGCHSLERHRMLLFYLEREVGIKDKRLRVLHTAPEPCIERRLKRLSNLSYISADLDGSRAMVQADLSALAFHDDSFDLALCMHVLDYLFDDEAAIRELYRVISPAGILIMQHTIDNRLEKTLEYNTLSEGEQKKAFAFPDRKRIYAADYFDKLKEVGFKVEVIPYASYMSQDIIGRYGLTGSGPLHICRKS